MFPTYKDVSELVIDITERDTDIVFMHPQSPPIV